LKERECNMSRRIGVIVGSLRKKAYSLLLAKQVIALLPQGYEGFLVDISHLPLYNEEFDETVPPEEYVSFRNEIETYDAFLFVTPEYNRSIPAAIKNALDVASRPTGQNKWAQKPGAVMSVSPGAYGGFGANHHLRQSLMFLDVPLLQQPEVYLGKVNTLLKDDGTFIEGTVEFLQQYVDAFIKHINRY